MSYRKLDIHGRVYEYTIGKQFVKFRAGDAVPLEKIGHPLGNDRFMVTPGTITEYLTTGKVYQGPRHCCNFRSVVHHCENMVTNLRPLPFDREIHDKLNYRFICDDCYARNAEEI